MEALSINSEEEQTWIEHSMWLFSSIELHVVKLNIHNLNMTTALLTLPYFNNEVIFKLSQMWTIYTR